MNNDASTKLGGARRTLAICLGLAVATVAVYWRVGGFGFVNYDDTNIFFGNFIVREGLTWHGIVWGATTCFYEYWHPLMWWSHMLDCQLFGLNAGPHHLMNLAFHVTNTLLVFAVFRSMTGRVWRSAVVAALFGLHPLHVESVAWLAERKDLLSTTFWLLSVWAYAGYVDKSRVQSPKSKVFYRLALFMFLLGLLSKPMVVTLPFVLLLLDYWPLNRIVDFRIRISDLKTPDKRGTLAWLAWEKWPFFALTALFCFITWYSVKIGNNFPPERVASPSVRWANIPIAYVRYLWKTIYPHDLAVLYPLPDFCPWWQVVGATLVLVAITGAVWRARSARYLVFGWLVFVGMLVPTIGIVEVGAQALADRYMYVPAIGLFVAAVWLVAEVSGRWAGRRVILGGATTMVLAACAWLSWVQVQYWHDSISLWTHCLAAGSDAAIVRLNCGDAFLAAGEPEKAIGQFQIVVEHNPDASFPSLAQTGSERLRADAYKEMGKALSAQGKSDAAVSSYLAALKLDPGNAATHYYLGLEYLKRGSQDDAVLSLERAAKSDPMAIGPFMQLAQIYNRRHETARAVSEYRAALRLNPNLPDALNNLAWILATTPDPQLRNGAEAVKLAERACERTSWQQTMLIGTLAAAYAEAGDFDKAVQTAQKACDLASAHGQMELLQANQALLAQYKNRQPFRDKN